MAVWRVPSGGSPGGSPANNMLFNGVSHNHALAGRPDADPKCCSWYSHVPDFHGPSTPYNAVTHDCCYGGTVAPNGMC